MRNSRPKLLPGMAPSFGEKDIPGWVGQKPAKLDSSG
jgi:hypothetical protein